jgi:hypothetical protein
MFRISRGEFVFDADTIEQARKGFAGLSPAATTLTKSGPIRFPLAIPQGLGVT